MQLPSQGPPVPPPDVGMHCLPAPQLGAFGGQSVSSAQGAQPGVAAPWMQRGAQRASTVQPSPNGQSLPMAQVPQVRVTELQELPPPQSWAVTHSTQTPSQIGVAVPASRPWQSALVRQAAQPVGVQKIPVPAAMHWESERHGTQMPLVVSQLGLKPDGQLALDVHASTQ
jgi:hypothetical protein